MPVRVGTSESALKINEEEEEEIGWELHTVKARYVKIVSHKHLQQRSSFQHIEHMHVLSR